MRFPSEPNEPGRTDPLSVALHEAARYEAETTAPEDLVARALARHDRVGSRCGPSRLAPALLALACGLGLLMSIGFWLHGAHSQPEGPSFVGPIPAVRPKPKAASPDSMAAAHIDIGPVLLPPIDPTKFLVSAGRLRYRQGGIRHGKHLRSRFSLAQNRSVSLRANSSDAIWKTETVNREVVTQTLTQVWVAHADPETATITLTPALFQLALQPDDADPTATQVGATLIPIRFEQEKIQP